MKELKTLKDLEKNRQITHIPYFVDEIKKEAIKWVKHLEFRRRKHIRTDVKFIMHFFNITEEDLK